MISYSDSENKRFHPLCEAALKQALEALGLSEKYEVKHEKYTDRLRMDFAILNSLTGKNLCVVEVKKDTC